jgi:hypothetical protein
MKLKMASAVGSSLILFIEEVKNLDALTMRMVCGVVR